MSPWGRKGMERVVAGSAKKLAKQIDKPSFLEQLKASWAPIIKKHTPIEEELARAMKRIENSFAFKAAFDAAGITESDIKDVLEQIREEKIDPIKYEHAKVGRNQLCPCGSGKKYKKCCGRDV
jgi:uncharacterized protein YecA (UPF0149 family)